MLSSIQGTVRTFDPATGSGDVLLDDGTVVAFDGTAFAAGGLRLLRFGQRVRLDYEDGSLRRVTLLTLS